MGARDLAFATLHPRKYAEIKQLVAQQRDERESYVSNAGEFLAREWRKSGSRPRFRPRQALLLDLHEDGQEGAGVHEIFDLTAMRVIVGSVKDCYGAIGSSTRSGSRFRAASRTSSRCPGEHVPGPAYDRDRAEASRSRSRSAPMRCTISPSTDRAHVVYKEVAAAIPREDDWLRQLVEAEGEQDRTSSSSPQGRSLRGRGLRLHAKGEVKNLSPARRRRLRLRRPHRRRPPHRRAKVTARSCPCTTS